jgi:hypothetical protein
LAVKHKVWAYYSVYVVLICLQYDVDYGGI